MKISKILFYSATVMVAGALVVGAVILRNQRAIQHTKVAPPVVAPWALHSARVQHQTVTSGFLALATKKADSEVVVTPQISGTIIAMGPREGQEFQPGTVLARIDDSQINDEISALKADLDAAVQQGEFQKKEFERQQSLLTKGFAVVAIGGLMVGTFLTLVAVPVFYYLLHRGHSKIAALFADDR